MNKIQMVDLVSQYNRLKRDIDNAIADTLQSGSFINGAAVKNFGDELSAYLGCEYVVPCANGTDALQIAMMACGFKPGDEVIVPAFTYVATVEVIALLGLTPVFIDVDPDDFNINIELLESAFTEKTVGIVPVHLYGQCAPMEAILSFAKEKKIRVIEDTAQALSAEYTFSNGDVKKAGTIGDIGTTSFFPSKNLGCFGDGGALITNDRELAVKMKMVANHGQSKKYIHDDIGVNSRLDTLQAAILSVKLRELDDFAYRRKIVADRYDKELSDLYAVTTPLRREYSSHVFHQYTLKVAPENRDKLKEYLSDQGIPSMIYYPIPVHLQNAYNRYGSKKGDFPISEQLCDSVISLPIHTEMSQETQDYIIQHITNYFNG